MTKNYFPQNSVMDSLPMCTIPLLWNANGLVEVIKDFDVCPVEVERVKKIIHTAHSEDSDGMCSPCSSSSSDIPGDCEVQRQSREEELEHDLIQTKCKTKSQDLTSQLQVFKLQQKLDNLHTDTYFNQNLKIPYDVKEKELKVHVCGICGKCFSRKFNLQTHMKCVHSDDKDYICSYCERAFNHSSNLRKHIKTVHCGEKRFSCFTCKKSFKSNDALKTHKRIIHSKTESGP